MIPLIFLDVETTGLQPDRHVPWEVAFVTAVHDAGWLRIRERYSRFRQLTPRERKLADPAALAIGRFDERYDEGNAVTSEDIHRALLGATARVSDEAMTKDKPHLVGGVPSFDHAMLCEWVIGWPAFGEGLWHYHLCDVETLAAGRLGWPPPYSSEALMEAFRVTLKPEDKHTAAGDVRWAIDLYAAVFNLQIQEPQ